MIETIVLLIVLTIALQLILFWIPVYIIKTKPKPYWEREIEEDA